MMLTWSSLLSKSVIVAMSTGENVCRTIAVNPRAARARRVQGRYAVRVQMRASLKSLSEDEPPQECQQLKGKRDSVKCHGERSH